MVRSYNIEDEADGFQVQLFMDGEQVAGAFVPDEDGTGASFNLAWEIAESFAPTGGMLPASATS